MRSMVGAAVGRFRQSILIRPLGFVVAGFVLALVALGVDAATSPGFVPSWLHFDSAVARTLLTTLAGATLTIAGITFWVRAAAVQMAASQFTPRVVQGFLHDWFQQSMMGLLLGIFAYVVVVLRAVPEPGGAMPHLSILVGILLAGGAVLAVLWAIRNGVESMQAGELARRITDRTVERIRQHHPQRTPHHQARESRQVPAGPGDVVRASSSGWVQEIDESRLLDAVASGGVVRVEVRVGVFVLEGRALCTLWSDEGVWLDAESRARRAFRLGRTRTTGNDIHYGIQQLADVARGSLTHGVADPSAAGEVIVNLEIILRELLLRDLPPVAYVDDNDRQLIRRRDYSLEDYVRVAFDELRVAAAPHLTAATAILDTLGTLVAELEQAGYASRALPLRQQARLTLAACEQVLLDEDLAKVRDVAARYGLRSSPWS